jgi:hypothetical protein
MIIKAGSDSAQKCVFASRNQLLQQDCFEQTVKQAMLSYVFANLRPCFIDMVGILRCPSLGSRTFVSCAWGAHDASTVFGALRKDGQRRPRQYLYGKDWFEYFLCHASFKIPLYYLVLCLARIERLSLANRYLPRVDHFSEFPRGTPCRFRLLRVILRC